MTLFAYSCVALPLWCVFFGLYFLLRRNKLFQESLWPKCAGTFLAVGSAGLALYRNLEDPANYGNPLVHGVFWAFVLCMLADALLEMSFVLGMGLFGVAHVLFIVWLWGVSPPVWQSWVIWGAALVVGSFLFRHELPRMGWMAVPCCAYVALLSGTLALAAPLPFLHGAGYWPTAIGALCFFVSDMMVAKSELNDLGDRYQKPIMFLYWGALYLLAVVLW